MLALAGFETEPNDRLALADPLAILPGSGAMLGTLQTAQDIDCFQVYVAEPCTVDVRVVTGASAVPLSGVGGTGGGGSHSDFFFPVLAFYGPDGRLLFGVVSSAPNLLVLDLPVPLAGESFYMQLSTLPGGRGIYGILVTGT